MRKYNNKDNAQRKNYYADRFFVRQETQKSDPNEKFSQELELLKDIKILNSYVEFESLIIYIEKENIVEAVKKIRDFGYEMLLDISGIDRIIEEDGIEVFYNFLSMSKKKRLRIKTLVKNKTFLQSVSNLYNSANWAERELYDMFGVWIKDHPNLKRIIMPDDWHSHPLLKTFPLQGDESAKWYEIDKIFGKEYREIVGPENRDPSFVDNKDTFNFSRIYHETPYGAPERPAEKYLQEYQEPEGVRFVKKIKRGQSKILKERP